MQVVILAGGVGKRMGELAREAPKPMVPIAGKPILEYQLDFARRHGLRDVHLLTGHRGDVIHEHFGEGERFGVRLTYHREAEPLGTAGAVRAIADQLAGDFLVFYGDTVFDIDLDAMLARHRAAGGLGTLLAHPNDHPHDSDLLDVDDTGRITAFHQKPRPNGVYYRNLVSAALYVLSPKLLAHVPAGRFADFGRDVFPGLVRRGVPLFAYNTPEYVKDVGTPARLREVERDIQTGRVARLNRRNPRPAVFLDRDGVLNAEVPGMVRSPEQLALLPGAAEAVRRINRSGCLAVVVTNQPIIAKGFATLEDLAAIHAKLETELGRAGAYVDRIYFCPHHPQRGFAGERAEFKIECTCRKPRVGMIDRATAELGIDLARSAIIGDRTADIAAGHAAGLRTVLVRTGEAGRDGKHPCKPDHVCDDVAAAVDLILREQDEKLIEAADERG